MIGTTISLRCNYPISATNDKFRNMGTAGIYLLPNLNPSPPNPATEIFNNRQFLQYGADTNSNYLEIFRRIKLKVSALIRKSTISFLLAISLSFKCWASPSPRNVVKTSAFATMAISSTVKKNAQSNLLVPSDAKDVRAYIAAKGWDPSNIPSVKFVNSRVICDPNNYLSKGDQIVIEQKIRRIWPKAQTGVLIVDKMDETFVNSVSKTRSGLYDASKAMASAAHNKWGVGEKGADNGIVIFLSIKDRSIFINTGKGVLHIIPDSKVTKLLADARPDLREAKYGKAIIDILDKVYTNINSPYPQDSSDSGILGTLPYAVGGLTGLYFLQSVNSTRALEIIRSSGNRGDGGSRDFGGGGDSDGGGDGGDW